MGVGCGSPFGIVWDARIGNRVILQKDLDVREIPVAGLVKRLPAIVTGYRGQRQCAFNVFRGRNDSARYARIFENRLHCAGDFGLEIE